MRSYSLCRELCLVQGIEIGLPGGHYWRFRHILPDLLTLVSDHIVGHVIRHSTNGFVA